MSNLKPAFTDLFIRRPVLAVVYALLILIAGGQAISTLTVRQYPESENASIVIRTVYVGADADLVRGFITTPIERVVASADGIDYLQSSSRQGLSEITARLKLNYDANAALAEISAKVDEVRADLPPEAEVPIITIQSADAQIAAAYLSFSSTLLQANEITDYITRVVQPRLTAVPGVQNAEILGGRNFALRAWLKPEAMAAYGIRPAEVRAAMATNNYLSAVGQTLGALQTTVLKAETDIRDIEVFQQMVIRTDGNRIIRLSDIAEVELGAQSYAEEVRFSGQDAVFIGVWVLPDANAIDVIAAVRQEMEGIRENLPTGLDANVAYDSTTYIETAIREVVSTLIETLVIVIIVIFLFMGSLRTVLVPVVSIPLSLIGAVFLMQVFGFTINLLTLLAIVLSVGLVVDDAIVMVENTERHIREGLKRRKAAILSARELVRPIIAMTITLAAVYAPIGLQGGLTGSLFREFAFTLAGAVLISGSVALIISPILSACVIERGKDPSGLGHYITLGFDKLRNLYGGVLNTLLNTRGPVYLIWGVLSFMCIPLFLLSPKELAPVEDQGFIISIVGDAPANYAIDETMRHTTQINEAFFSLEDAAYSFQITFAEGGFGGVVLKPWDERRNTVFDLMPELTEKLADIPGLSVFPVTPPPLPGGGDFPVEFVLASTSEVGLVLEVADAIRDAAMESGAFAFLTIDTKIDLPEVEIRLDREKIAAMGLSMQDIGFDLATLMSGGFVNFFNIDGRSYRVIPQVERISRLNPEQLLEHYITGPDGTLIPLRAIATLEERVVPRSLNRFQQLNAVKISGMAIRPLAEALDTLDTIARERMPEGFVIDYTGESRQLRLEGDNFLPVFMLAVSLIFLVLAAQFNSFRDPLVILLGSVPLALFGSLCFTFLRMLNPNLPFWTDGFTTTLNIYSQVGLVTLVGLVAKNGILIVEFANVLQLEGKTKLQAVHEAAMTRLRPILMTSAATVFGHFPLVLVTGAGAAARNSIGLVLVGGMAIGTFFTLLVVPCLYMLIAKTKQVEVDPMADE
jgi:multidrug efflux pump